MYVKTPNKKNNQDIADHTIQDWIVFVLNKWSKQKHSKVVIYLL